MRQTKSEAQKFQPGWILSGMSSAKKASPGKALVESLTRQLAANMEFDETETNTLDLIAHAADRPAAVRARFDVVEH